MSKPLVLVIERDARHVEGVRIALSGRFQVEQARSAAEALAKLDSLEPLVVVLGLRGLEAAKAIREKVGRGTLLIGHGRFGHGHKARGMPNKAVVEAFALDDFVARDLSGEDVGKVVWSHIARAIRAVPRPEGQPAASTEDTWKELATSEASLAGLRKLLNKPVLPVTELKDDQDATWKDLLTAPIGQTLKRLFRGKKPD